jgi:hypothetical protein
MCSKDSVGMSARQAVVFSSRRDPSEFLLCPLLRVAAADMTEKEAMSKLPIATANKACDGAPK